MENFPNKFMIFYLRPLRRPFFLSSVSSLVSLFSDPSLTSFSHAQFSHHIASSPSYFTEKANIIKGQPPASSHLKFIFNFTHSNLASSP